MSNKLSLDPTPSELEVLQFLWKEGPSTVKEVHAFLTSEKDKDIGYTSTLKTMQVMFDRGFLKREAMGRKHIYEAAIQEEATKDKLLDRFLRNAFEGSALNLVMKALGNYKTTSQELNELKKYINEIEKDQES